MVFAFLSGSSDRAVYAVPLSYFAPLITLNRIVLLQVVSSAVHTKSVKRLGLIYRADDVVAECITYLYAQHVSRLDKDYGSRQREHLGELGIGIDSTPGSGFRGIWLKVHAGSLGQRKLSGLLECCIHDDRTTDLPDEPGMYNMID